MARWWDEFVALIGDRVGLGLTTLLLFLAAALVAAGWYFWPRWLPRRRPGRDPVGGRRRWRWPRLRRPRLRWRRPRWRWPWRRRRRDRTGPADPGLVPHETDELPELPVEAFQSLADRLAAEGRYAEAVRERLRGIVRALVDAGAVENRPGWTVTELARAAAEARPAVREPLAAATRLFSDIWYGQRPAGPEHDARMRDHAAQVRAALTPVGVS